MLYELTYLISPDLNEAELKDFSQKIDSLISKSAKLIKSETPRKINLAYPIQKKEEAFLKNCEFNEEPGKIEEFKKELNKEKNILRFLLIKKTTTLPRPNKEKEIKTVRKITKRKPKKKAGLKEIGEKLKELI